MPQVFNFAFFEPRFALNFVRLYDCVKLLNCSNKRKEEMKAKANQRQRKTEAGTFCSRNSISCQPAYSRRTSTKNEDKYLRVKISKLKHLSSRTSDLGQYRHHPIRKLKMNSFITSLSLSAIRIPLVN